MKKNRRKEKENEATLFKSVAHVVHMKRKRKKRKGKDIKRKQKRLCVTLLFLATVVTTL